ncbi:MAG: glycosyltransferase family 4 protein [Minisyncoccota bacterium]
MNQETAQNPKKVLFMVTKSNFGGAQRYVFDITTTLPKDAFDVVALCGAAQDSKSAGPLIDMLKHAGIRTIFIPEMTRDVRTFNDIRVFFSIVRTIRAERPDIVHLNSSKAGGLGAFAARLSGVQRIVFTSHGLAYDEPRFFLSRFAIYLATWMTFLLSHRVICISKDTAHRAARLPFCARKVRLVYNGLRAPEMLERDQARAQLLSVCPDIPTNMPWIGTISELVPNKGLSYALKACDVLHRSGERFVFLIVGSGELQKSLTALIAERGLAEHVRLLGYVAQASKLLKAFDIFTLTSRKEGLPYVLLEAGYAALPVAATNIPGINDIVEDGESGALCPSDDPELFAHALSELLEHEPLRARLGSSLKKRVEADFNFEKMLSGTLTVYRD